jgi:hypothetical protein
MHIFLAITLKITKIRYKNILVKQTPNPHVKHFKNNSKIPYSCPQNIFPSKNNRNTYQPTKITKKDLIYGTESTAKLIKVQQVASIKLKITIITILTVSILPPQSPSPLLHTKNTKKMPNLKPITKESINL